MAGPKFNLFFKSRKPEGKKEKVIRAIADKSLLAITLEGNVHVQGSAWEPFHLEQLCGAVSASSLMPWKSHRDGDKGTEEQDLLQSPANSQRIPCQTKHQRVLTMVCLLFISTPIINIISQRQRNHIIRDNQEKQLFYNYLIHQKGSFGEKQRKLGFAFLCHTEIRNVRFTKG